MPTLEMRSRRMPHCLVVVCFFFVLPWIAEFTMKHTPRALMMQAIEDGQIASVHSWLKRGVSPNSVGWPTHESGISFWYVRLLHPHDQDTSTALMLARSNVDIVRLLMDSGADASTKEASALRYAAYRGDIGVLGVYLDYKLPTTALVAAVRGAAEANQISVMEFLFSRGVPMDGEDIKGWSPLLAAVRASNWKCADFILAKGANIDYKNKKNGKTTLIRVADEGSPESVTWLVTHHANVNLRDSEGHTALYYALRRGDKGIATLLKQAGGME